MSHLFFSLVIFLFILISVVMSVESTTESRWHVMERKSNQGSPFQRLHFNDFVKGDRASPDEMITLTFAVKQNNIDDLASSIADPKSPNYGKHLTRDEVIKLTQNPEGENAVREYLKQFGITVHDLSANSYISGNAPVQVWEQALHTEFYHFSNTKTGQNLIRTEEYSLPESLSNYVHTVLNTVQLPPPLHSSPKMTPLEPGNEPKA